MQQVRAKKHLGQHFLKDQEIARRITESLSPCEVSSVLEIGPGTGVLTQYILQNQSITNFKAVEIDKESVDYLRLQFPTLNLLQGDFLKMNMQEIFSDKFSIIGNFPYNISSQIFFKVLDNREQIHEVVCMIQKEVAQRIASPAGNKTYGILSVLMQAFYTTDYLFTVHEHVFDPPPKVKSAVVRFTRNEVKHLDCDEKLFRTVVKTAFNQRRKTLRNSLKPLVEKENPMFAEEIFNKRPEQLDVQSFIHLTNIVQHAMK